MRQQVVRDDHASHGDANALAEPLEHRQACVVAVECETQDRLPLRRLTGGDGTHDPDSGATTVRWSGTISANLYDELVPTWFSDLTLSIDDAGSGTLSATVAGYASSLENPDVRQEVPPIPGVVIARFRTTGTGPGPMTVTPDYLGVRYESTATPQVRTTPSWGAWPPAMVAAMERTAANPMTETAKPVLPTLPLIP